MLILDKHTLSAMRLFDRVQSYVSRLASSTRSESAKMARFICTIESTRFSL